MRNLKKFLALVLAMMMTLSLMVTVNASSFDDDDDITAAYGEAVDVLSELGVINGYGEGDPNEGKFLPKNNITRGEVAAILYRIHTGDVDDDYIHLYKDYSEFSDVLPGDWFAPYVNYCANNELIKGVGNGKFAPRANITGYEALVMILRAMGYNNPNEFTTSDWKAKASGYGNRHGLTTNIPAGSLGGSATREMVSEIMFKGLLAPMQNYSFLTGYTTDLLVDAKAVNAAAGAGAVVYAADVPNTLMYQTFKIVGQRTILGSDNYGRPQTEWVKDLDTDTVENGGKYIANLQTAAAIAAGDNLAVTGGGDSTAVAAGAGEAYISVKTPDADYITADTRKDADGNPLTAATGAGIEDAELEIVKTPTKVYKGTVVTECQFTTDVNNNKTIAAANITEYLNGGAVDTRAAALDINHTQEGTIGAPGRTTEVYKIGDDFIIVYIDTFMGVVTKVINRTFDTAGNHVMSDAELHVKVNDTVTVVDTSSKKDFDYKVGELVLMNTYGLKNDDGTGDANLIDPDHVQTMVPAVASDFLPDDTETDDYGVDTIGKPTSEEVTVKGTFGTKNHKTGLETDKGDRNANVVFLANKALNDDNTGVLYYATAAASKGETAINDGADGTTTTVPSTSPYNYGYRMANAAINKTYTVYKDANGFVVGMTQNAATTDVGVVMGMEPVRIGTGKWAIEADLMMMDKTTKTVRMLKNWKADGTAHNDGDEDKFFDYYENMGDAETGIGTDNLKAEAGVLVKIEAFNKNGETYYKVVETQDGKWKNYTDPKAVGDNQLVPGDAGTLEDECGTVGDVSTFAINTNYSKSPSQIDASNAAVKQNVDDNTKFLISELTWDYSLNEENQGGYADMEYSAYTGFKTIPLIVGDAEQTVATDNTYDVMYQRIGNNVFVFPNTDKTKNTNLNYTVMARTPVADPDLYLVYATGTTYQEYSTYKALKNGEYAELKVSNNNLTNINKTIEDAMVAGSEALIRVTGTNGKGYATSVAPIDRDIVAAATVYFDKTGVLAYDTDGGATNGTAIDTFLAVADDVVVKIVNMTTGKYYDATLDSVSQYEKYTGSHAFVLDFDEYGYVDTIYIID